MITDGQTVAVVTDLLRQVAAAARIVSADGRPLSVVVFDGPTEGAEYAELWLAAGAPWQDEQQAVTTLEELVGAGRRSIVTHSVACSAFAASGGLDLPEWRRLVGELLAVLRDILRRDRTLAGRVALARLGADRQQSVIADEQGAAVMIGFTVELVLL